MMNARHEKQRTKNQLLTVSQMHYIAVANQSVLSILARSMDARCRKLMERPVCDHPSIETTYNSFRHRLHACEDSPGFPGRYVVDHHANTSESNPVLGVAQRATSQSSVNETGIPQEGVL